MGWLTATFYGVAAAYFLGRLSATMLVWPRPDAGSLNNFALFYLFCLVVVTAFANAIVGVAMTREAMEPGTEWKTAFFSVGRREWGLFGNLLLLYVVVIGLVTAIVFAGEVGAAVSLPMIGNGGVWKGIALAPVMRAAFAAISVAVGVFLTMRFGFFLTPITVADPPARLLQSWISSRGNFWRLLVLSLGLLVPVVIVALLADWALLGSQFTDAIVSLLATPPDNGRLFHMIQNNSAAIAAVAAAALLLWNAIFAGASADAYARVEHDGEEVRPALAPMMAPAFAATATPHLAAVDVHRIEPGFIAGEVVERAAKLPEAKPGELNSEEAEPADAVPEEQFAEPIVVAPQGGGHGDGAHAEPEEIEFKTVEDVPATSSAVGEPEAARAESGPVSAGMHEEPLAPHDPLPAADPLHHSAAIDPSDDSPATPLPSFVRSQPSPSGGSSEAA
ncbi:MAG: hypothetical protein ACTHLR_07530 [Rhizomicrobium sp.]